MILDAQAAPGRGSDLAVGRAHAHDQIGREPFQERARIGAGGDGEILERLVVAELAAFEPGMNPAPPGLFDGRHGAEQGLGRGRVEPVRVREGRTAVRGAVAQVGEGGADDLPAHERLPLIRLQRRIEMLLIGEAGLVRHAQPDVVAGDGAQPRRSGRPRGLIETDGGDAGHMAAHQMGGDDPVRRLAGQDPPGDLGLGHLLDLGLEPAGRAQGGQGDGLRAWRRLVRGRRGAFERSPGVGRGGIRRATADKQNEHDGQGPHHGLLKARPVAGLLRAEGGGVRAPCRAQPSSGMMNIRS